MAGFCHNVDYPAFACRSPIETSPASPIEMSRSSVCRGLSGWRGMTVITMSRKELTRLRVLIDIAAGRLSVADATGLLGVGRRQVYRLLDAFRACGPDGLISRKRGGPSNRARGLVFRETVLAIVRERYSDFGPTLAAEKLSELHGLDLGVETLRQWMIGAGLWVRRKDRLKRIHQPRARRDCLGELVQSDGFVRSAESWHRAGRRDPSRRGSHCRRAPAQTSQSPACRSGSRRPKECRAKTTWKARPRR